MKQPVVMLLPLLAALLVEGSARAAQPDLSEAERAVFAEAVAAAAKEDWALCRTKAAGVWDTNKNPTVAALLGSCEAELGMDQQAATHLDFFLQRDDKSKPKQTEAALKRFPRVREKVTLVELTSVPATEVRVDGTVIGQSPARIFLSPGQHEITLSAPGYATRIERVETTAGGSKSLDLKLEPEGAATTGAGGAAGTGGGSATAGSGGGGPIELPPEPDPVWPAVLLGSVAGAALLTGVGLTIGSRVERSGAIDDVTACDASDAACRTAAQDDIDHAALLQNVGFAMYGVAAAAAVGMGLYLGLSKTDGNAAEFAFVVPIVAPGTLGLVVVGGF